METVIFLHITNPGPHLVAHALLLWSDFPYCRSGETCGKGDQGGTDFPLLTSPALAGGFLSAAPPGKSPTFSLSIYLLGGIYVISISWLLLIMLLSPWECRCLFSDQSSSSVSLDLEAGLVDHVVLLLIFEELPYCAPQWLHQLTIPQAVHKEKSSFLCILSNVCYFYLLEDQHPNRCEVRPHNGFSLHFP